MASTGTYLGFTTALGEWRAGDDFSPITDAERKALLVMIEEHESQAMHNVTGSGPTSSRTTTCTCS